MKILGKYTGLVYELDEKENMEECGIQITDEVANDPKKIEELHSKYSDDCSLCRGCPMYMYKLEDEWLIKETANK